MVLFTREEIEKLRKRAKEDPSVLKELYGRCSAAVDHGVRIQKTGMGTWPLYFACPDCAANLTFDYTNEHEYTCPKCGKVVSGEPYLGAWWACVNDRMCDTSYAAALIWLLTDDEKYRLLSREILIGFADNYENYEEHGGIPYNNGGRMDAQTLDDASYFQDMARGYDLIRDTLTDEERAHIENDLFIPGCELLMKNRKDQLHNHEVIISAGVGMTGLAIGRRDFIEFALNSKYGLRYQLEHALLSDSLWFEATFGYHFYALRSFIAYERMALHTEYGLRHLPQYRRMLKMALKVLQPDYSAPLMGDCHPTRMFRGLFPYYEFGYRLYGDSEFAGMLNAIYSEIPRGGLTAMLLGADEIEPAGPPELNDSHNDCGSGLTVMRGTDKRQYLMMRHGRYGGEHDHYDKLGLHFACDMNPVMTDLSTVHYGAPHHYGYYKNTFTHNTVSINAQNQPPCDGRTVRYEKCGSTTLIEAEADWRGPAPELDSFIISQWDEEAYKDVLMRRTVLHTDGYFLEAFRVRGAKGRQVDWVIHPVGACTEHEAEKKPVKLGDSAPVGFMKNARGFEADGLVGSSWEGPAGRFSVYSACSAESLAVYAEGPGNPTSETLTYFIRRATDSDDIVFANIFALERGGKKIEKPSIEISGGTVTAQFLFGGEPVKHVFTVGEAE